MNDQPNAHCRTWDLIPWVVNGTATDLVAAYNAANSRKLKTMVNWTPTLTAGLETSVKNLLTDLATTTGAGSTCDGAGLAGWVK